MERLLHGTQSYQMECRAHVDGTVDYRLPKTRWPANVQTFRWEGVGTREKGNLLWPQKAPICSQGDVDDEEETETEHRLSQLQEVRWSVTKKLSRTDTRGARHRW